MSRNRNNKYTSPRSRDRSSLSSRLASSLQNYETSRAPQMPAKLPINSKKTQNMRDSEKPISVPSKELIPEVPLQTIKSSEKEIEKEIANLEKNTKSSRDDVRDSSSKKHSESKKYEKNEPPSEDETDEKLKKLKQRLKSKEILSDSESDSESDASESEPERRREPEPERRRDPEPERREREEYSDQEYSEQSDVEEESAFDEVPIKSFLNIIKEGGANSVTTDAKFELRDIMQDFIETMFEAISEHTQTIETQDVKQYMKGYLTSDSELPENLVIKPSDFENVIKKICAKLRLGIKRETIYLIQLFTECIASKIVEGAIQIAENGRRTRIDDKDLTISYRIYML
jgi:histone H3/H4